MNTDMTRALLEAAEILRDDVKDVDTAVVLGSGLGDYGSSLTDAREFPYSMFPGFPVSTVPGHAGKMIVGRVGNKKVILLRHMAGKAALGHIQRCFAAETTERHIVPIHHDGMLRP